MQRTNTNNDIIELRNNELYFYKNNGKLYKIETYQNKEIAKKEFSKYPLLKQTHKLVVIACGYMIYE